MVDYPGAAFWRQLTAHYPDAKVLHTTRDPDKWFDSTQATIFSPANGAASPDDSPRGRFFSSWMGPIREHLGDRAFMTDHFRRHDAEVIATIPADRLLVYQVGEGWDRLCAFLGVPVPDQPYPSENSTGDFVARMRERAAQQSTA